MTPPDRLTEEFRRLDDELSAAVVLPSVDAVIGRAATLNRASTAAAAAVLTVGILGGLTAVAQVGGPRSTVVSDPAARGVTSAPAPAPALSPLAPSVAAATPVTTPTVPEVRVVPPTTRARVLPTRRRPPVRTLVPTPAVVAPPVAPPRPAPPAVTTTAAPAPSGGADPDPPSVSSTPTRRHTDVPSTKTSSNKADTRSGTAQAD